jgi:hypothetical protein
MKAIQLNKPKVKVHPIHSEWRVWTYPASVDTFLSRGVLFFQSNLLELSGTQLP